MVSPRKRLSRRDKGKPKMLQQENNGEASDQSESDNVLGSDDGPSKVRTDLAKRAIKTTNEKLRQSTHQKTPVICYGYNEYMVHHYAYMMKVASIRELESFAEAIWVLATNDTWDLVDPPKDSTPIR